MKKINNSGIATAVYELDFKGIHYNMFFWILNNRTISNFGLASAFRNSYAAIICITDDYYDVLYSEGLQLKLRNYAFQIRRYQRNIPIAIIDPFSHSQKTMERIIRTSLKREKEKDIPKGNF